ncbi:MAG: exodeoxyribonuclease VII large subunit, partial [Phenylobacterium sp.]|nr:exodeoxyribonuclease VII large subunit [Phenylobacterium sp.]
DHGRDLARISARLTPALLARPQATQRQQLDALSARLNPALARTTERLAERLAAVEKLRQSLNPDRPLSRGFARVHRADGSLAREGAALVPGETVSLVFADTSRNAVIDGDAAAARPIPEARPKPRKPSPPASTAQGDLF